MGARRRLTILLIVGFIVGNETGNGTERNNGTDDDTLPSAIGGEDNKAGDDDDDGDYDAEGGPDAPPPEETDDPLDDIDTHVEDDDPPDQPPKGSWTDYFKKTWVLVLTSIFLGIIIFFMFASLIYTKIKHDQLLNHEMRMSIYDHIEKHPGQHFRNILKDMGLKSGVLTHHINMLEREEYIKSVQDGIYRRFYIYGAETDGRHLLTEHQQNILNTIKSDPGLSQTEIANKLGITRMLVNYHLKVLKNEGLIVTKRKGRKSSCYPKEENT
jgi:predicted transcriptional regulator